MQPSLETEALDENSLAERLRELAASGNKTVCQAVAKNPNTPTDLLWIWAKDAKFEPLLLARQPRYEQSNFSGFSMISVIVC